MAYWATQSARRRQQQTAAAFSALPPLQQQALLAQIAGTSFAAPKKEPQESFFGKLIPNIVERAAGQIGESLLYTIPGLYEAGKAITGDIVHGEYSPVNMASDLAHGRNPLPSRTFGIAEGMGRNVLTDIQHPTERPGYLLLDALSLASMGAGTAVRASTAGRTLSAGLRARRGFDPGAPPPTVGRPTPVAPPPLSPISPVRSPSAILAETSAPRELAPLVRGHHYRIETPAGSLNASYVRTGAVKGNETHFFRTLEGKSKQVAAKNVTNVTLWERAMPEFAGEQVSNKLSQVLAEEKPLPAAYKAPPPEKPAPGLPETAMKTKTGRTVHKDVGGKFVKPAEAPPEEARIIAAEQEISKVIAQPAPVVKQTVKFDKVGDAAVANVGEGERVVVQANPQGSWTMHFERAGKVSAAREFADAPAALKYAKGFAERYVNRPSGGSEVPSVGRVARDTARAFFRRPSGGMRQIEHFKKQEPIFAPETRQIERQAAQGGQALELFPRTEAPEVGSEPLNLVMRKDPETGNRIPDTGTIEKANVVLSPNPAARFLHNQWIDVMEKNPELRVGPWGRNLESYVRFNQKEAKRIVGDAKAAGLTAQVMDAERRVRKGEPAFQVLDSMNMVAKIWLLYLKPAYLFANLAGQELIHLADHAWSPNSVAKSVRLQWALYKDPRLAGARAAKIKGAMMENGVTMAFTQEHGLNIIPRLRKKLPRYVRPPGYESYVKFYNMILDTPFRDNAFITEARRQGFDSPERLIQLVDDSAYADKFEEIARRANRNIIDYGRLGSVEKRWIRRVIFFYPWFKGASVYAGHFLAEHPAQALIAQKLGQQGAETQLRELGPVPSFLQGVFKVGERNVPGLGKMPLIVNPKATTVLGTPGEVLQAGMAALGGQGGESTQISQYLTPALSTAITAITRTDPFTGAPVPANYAVPDIVLDQLMKTAAPLRAFQQLQRADKLQKGQLDPASVLFPYTKGEVVGRFGLSVYPYALNTRESRSRAFSEQRSLASRREREVLKNKDYRDRFLEAGRQTKQFATMPPDLSQAFRQRAQVSAEVAAYEAQLGQPARMIDRLQAVVGLLVRQGQMDSGQAKALLASMVSASDSQIEVLKNKLTNTYFGGTTISQYRASLNAAGAKLTVP